MLLSCVPTIWQGGMVVRLECPGPLHIRTADHLDYSAPHTIRCGRDMAVSHCSHTVHTTYATAAVLLASVPFDKL